MLLPSINLNFVKFTMWLTQVSLKNPYFATVIMLCILLLGLVSLKKIAVEEFPDIKFPVVVVTTTYKGASPEVIETDISRPIEEALNSLNGIKDIRSYSFEAQSVVVAEFNLNVDPEQALQDARDKVSIVASSFHKEIDVPIVSKVNVRDNPIMSLTVASDSMSLRDITDWINRVLKKKIQTVPGVGDVKIVGGLNRQVRIDIDPYKLQALDISATDVINAIKNANDNYSAGDVKTRNSTINVKLNGKLLSPYEFANIVVSYRHNVPIRISDVANVEDGQDQYDSLTLVDGKRAVGLDIRPSDRANVVDVSDNVYKMLKTIDQIKPHNLIIKVTYDQTRSTRQSLSSVEQTLFEGAALTIIIVFIFLKSWRSTVITGLTLPIALIGTIFAIYVLNFTLNMMTLMALSLSIGLLVDDAIVVRENIVRHLNMGKDHYTAALDGTNEIGLAVLSTTLTVVAVFLPVGFMSGIIGKFFFQFGITVTVSVLISLLVSFILDPMLSSIWHEPKDGGVLGKHFIGQFLNSFERNFNKVIDKYESFIRLSLRFKKSTLAISLAILVGSFLLVPLIGGEFIPQSDKGIFAVNFRTVVGANINYTEAKIKQINSILYQNIPEIKTVTAGINKNFGDSTNNASLDIDIGSKLKRVKTQNQIMEEVRNLLQHVGGIEVQSIMPLGAAGGDDKPINVDIKGDSILVLKEIADSLMRQLEKVKGITDLENSYQQANPAYSVNVDRDIASNLGINLSDVGNALSILFAGNKVSTWEDPKNGQNYDVVIQIPEEERSQDALNLLKVVSNRFDDNNLPHLIALSAIATKKAGLTPRELDHIDLQRKITITGNVDGSNNQVVFNDIQKILDSYKLPNGYKITQSGNKQDMEESFSYAVSALLIGVAFIYMILTAQFRSFILPLVIMVALPLSFVGVFIALFLCNSTLNMFSIIGIIMLMGLATKNGILLVDFINEDIKRGIDKIEAIVNAGKTRLRPIIMTSCAMIFGMLPVALSNGEGAETRKPMAYAIIGGMTTSTLLTLIVVPVIYVYLQQLSSYLQSKFNQ